MHHNLLRKLTRQQLQQIDVAASQFELDLAAGQQPSIEAVVQSVDADLQSSLIAELISTELDFLRTIGQTPVAEEYLSRFPQRSKIISAIFDPVAESEDKTGAGDRASDPSGKPEAAATQQMNTSDTDSFVRPISRAADTAIASVAHVEMKADDITLPEQFGRYRIERVLGTGGMGTVYLAEDTQLKRRVALKIPRFSSGETTGAERFLREARAMATVEHPNLCPVHDVGEIDGQHFLTMTYIDGPTLAEVLQQEGQLPTERAVDLTIQIAEAVQVAHDAGIVHRDLKPANIMINQRDEPVIMDFGLARTQHAQNSTLTHDGMIVGSPAYMAPEQVDADGDAIGPRTDVYALGVILYEMLSDRRPYEGSVMAVLGQIKAGTPMELREHSPQIHRQLAAICTKAMAPDANRRFSSATQLAESLTSFLSDNSTKRITGRHRAIAAAALLLIAVCFAVYVIKTPDGTVTVTAPDHVELDVKVRRDGQDDLEFHVHPGEPSFTSKSDSGLPDGRQRTSMFVDAGLALRGVYSTSVVAGDLDGDGRPDAVVGTNSPSDVRIYWNNGDGEFGRGELPSDVPLGRAGNTALGDLDGDGDLDIYLARSNGVSDLVLLNDGGRIFRVTEDRLGGETSSAIALDDLDGDEDVDVWVASKQGKHTVWLNDGRGRFSEARLTLPSVPTSVPSIALADFDLDGDVDAFTKFQLDGEAPEACFCWNDGSAGFTLSDPVAGLRGIARGAAADFNGDGRVDLVVIFEGSRLGILRNLRDEWRLEEISNSPLLGAWHLTVADFNCDASPDIAVAIKEKNGITSDMRNIVWLNDGEGHFRACDPLPGGRPTLRLAAADFDLDGDVDLFEANGKDAPDRILWNVLKP